MRIGLGFHHQNPGWQVACRVDRNEGTYSTTIYATFFGRISKTNPDIRDKIRFPHSSSLVLT